MDKNGQSQAEISEANVQLSEQQKKERQWLMLCHLSALVAFIGVPFGHILAPLLVWQVKKNDFPAIDFHGKEALNFQISMTIYLLIAGILCLVFIGFLVIIPLIIADIVLPIIAGLKANNGEDYQYPLSIRFIK